MTKKQSDMAIVFSDEGLKKFNVMKLAIGVTSNSELIQKALQLYALAIEKTGMGYELRFVKDDHYYAIPNIT